MHAYVRTFGRTACRTARGRRGSRNGTSHTMTTRRSAILHNMRGRLVSGGLGCITTGPSAGRGAQASRAEGPEVSVELRRGAFFVPSGSLTGWVNRAWCFSSGTTRSCIVATLAYSSASASTPTTTSSHTWKPSICSSRCLVSLLLSNHLLPLLITSL